jgi:hypothetical protein
LLGHFLNQPIIDKTFLNKSQFLKYTNKLSNREDFIINFDRPYNNVYHIRYVTNDNIERDELTGDITMKKFIELINNTTTECYFGCAIQREALNDIKKNENNESEKITVDDSGSINSIISNHSSFKRNRVTVPDYSGPVYNKYNFKEFAPNRNFKVVTTPVYSNKSSKCVNLNLVNNRLAYYLPVENNHDPFFRMPKFRNRKTTKSQRRYVQYSTWNKHSNNVHHIIINDKTGEIFSCKNNDDVKCISDNILHNEIKEKNVVVTPSLITETKELIISGDPSIYCVHNPHCWTSDQCSLLQSSKTKSKRDEMQSKMGYCYEVYFPEQYRNDARSILGKWPLYEEIIKLQKDMEIDAEATGFLAFNQYEDKIHAISTEFIRIEIADSNEEEGFRYDEILNPNYNGDILGKSKFANMKRIAYVQPWNKDKKKSEGRFTYILINTIGTIKSEKSRIGGNPLCEKKCDSKDGKKCCKSHRKISGTKSQKQKQQALAGQKSNGGTSHACCEHTTEETSCDCLNTVYDEETREPIGHEKPKPIGITCKKCNEIMAESRIGKQLCNKCSNCSRCNMHMDQFEIRGNELICELCIYEETVADNECKFCKSGKYYMITKDTCHQCFIDNRFECFKCNKLDGQNNRHDNSNICDTCYYSMYHTCLGCLTNIAKVDNYCNHCKKNCFHDCDSVPVPGSNKCRKSNCYHASTTNSFCKCHYQLKPIINKFRSHKLVDFINRHPKYSGDGKIIYDIATMGNGQTGEMHNIILKFDKLFIVGKPLFLGSKNGYKTLCKTFIRGCFNTMFEFIVNNM